MENFYHIYHCNLYKKICNIKEHTVLTIYEIWIQILVQILELFQEISLIKFINL